MKTTYGIMDAPKSELPEILKSFLSMIGDMQAEATPEFAGELSDAYDQIETHYRYIQGITPEIRNQIRMTMKHIYKVATVEMSN